MFDYVHQVLSKVEASIQTPSLAAVLPPLRAGLGLDDFGEMMLSMPMRRYPKLSRVLPRMASADVQNNWTGNNGLPLLRQSANFVRSAAFNYSRLTGRSMDGIQMLDYGCGYGRLARLMYYFTDPENLHGVDPWDRSIDICREDGLGENFHLSHYLPDDLPLPRRDFNFIYAFSVFTHLSLRATRKALDVCRQFIAADGVMLITIRPVEYWDLDASIHGLKDTAALKRAHQNEGFAFSPLNLPPVDGDRTYGNTSMTTQWIEANFPRWHVATIDRSLDDAYQIYVTLRPQ